MKFSSSFIGYYSVAPLPHRLLFRVRFGVVYPRPLSGDDVEDIIALGLLLLRKISTRQHFLLLQITVTVCWIHVPYSFLYPELCQCVEVNSRHRQFLCRNASIFTKSADPPCLFVAVGAVGAVAWSGKFLYSMSTTTDCPQPPPVLTSTRLSSWTFLKCRWISAGEIFFADRNSITHRCSVRTSLSPTMLTDCHSPAT